MTEGIYLFLSRNFPAVYFVVDGELKLVRDIQPSFLINCGE